MEDFLFFLEKLKEKDNKLINAIQTAFIECVIEEKTRDYGSGILFICPSKNSVLLALRGDSGEDANVWCGIGGKGELGEIPIQTAMREVYEEARFIPSHYKLHPEPIYVHQNDPSFKFITYLGIMDVEMSPTINDEHKDSKWVKFNELSQLPLHYGFIAILKDQKALNVINKYCKVI